MPLSDRLQQIIRQQAARLNAHGIVESHQLDCAVHDCAAYLATGVNNAGIESQLAFIAEHEGERSMNELVENLLEIKP